MKRQYYTEKIQKGQVYFFLAYVQYKFGSIDRKDKIMYVDISDPQWLGVHDYRGV